MVGVPTGVVRSSDINMLNEDYHITTAMNLEALGLYRGGRRRGRSGRIGGAIRRDRQMRGKVGSSQVGQSR
ncbi:hypothetical protein PIB30_018440 [Stylosanthes scabra]|uniref:Uncharacterized protein n=1 Tax=Stylosanthes scabra TaxID=79078 RepID=A0ABU6UAK9_9FABA|nr:hypothetical protein [Stylosanthes scabra]